VGEVLVFIVRARCSVDCYLVAVEKLLQVISLAVSCSLGYLFDLFIKEVFIMSIASLEYTIVS
jgi:hypothetical protein